MRAVLKLVCVFLLLLLSTFSIFSSRKDDEALDECKLQHL